MDRPDSAERSRETVIQSLRAVVLGMAQPVVAARPTGELRVCNAAFASLWSDSSTIPLEGQTFSEAMHRADGPFVCSSHLEHWISAREERKETSIGEAFAGKDGRVLEVDFVPIRAAGEYLGNLWQIRDVTEVRRQRDAALLAEQRALEAERAAQAARSRFLSQISHDLRTPLHAILGSVEHLQRNGAVQNDDLERIGRSARTLRVVIDDLFDLASAEEPFVAEPVVFDFAELTDFITSASLGLKPDWRIATDVAQRYLGDLRRLRQILLNVLVHAERHAATALRVVVARWRDGANLRGVSFEIEAQGVDGAIASAVLGTAVNDLLTGQRGRGLRLQLARHLVEGLGGTLRQNAGGFLIQIPLVEAAASVSIFQMNQEILARGRILVVDDEEENLHVLQQTLTGDGHEVFLAQTGEAALSLCRVLDPDLIFLDLMMPDLSGNEVRARLLEEADATGPAPPMVALTADAQVGVAEQCRALGYADAAYKPIHADAVRRFVRRHLRRRVLVVDDDADMRELMQLVLVDEGWAVELAEDGQSALSLLSRRPFHLVLADIEMPGVNGWELAERLATWVNAPTRLALTGHRDAQTRRALMVAGYAEVLIKPIETLELISAVRRNLP